MAELDLPGHYHVNCVQSRHQLSDFLDSMDTSCLQVYIYTLVETKHR